MDGSHGEMRDCVLRIHHLQSGSASSKLKQADVMHRKKEIKCIIFLLPVISMRQKSCISFFFDRTTSHAFFFAIRPFQLVYSNFKVFVKLCHYCQKHSYVFIYPKHIAYIGRRYGSETFMPLP